jgi:hypothetical protein
MQVATDNGWRDRIRRQIFPPECTRQGCDAAHRIWRSKPMILFDDHWVCSAECLEGEAYYRFKEYGLQNRRRIQRHRLPLGLLLLSRGYISAEQLEVVLATQQRSGEGRLGACAQRLHFITEQQLLSTLSLQMSCPVLALQGPRDLTCAALIPGSVLRSLRIMPVRFVRSTRLLYLASSETIEPASSAAIEHMLGCQVVPCLVSDHTMDRWLESASSASGPPAQLFEKSSGAMEMARILGSYAGRLGVDEVRMVHCGSYAWVRLKVKRESSDLLFRVGEPHCEDIVAADECGAPTGMTAEPLLNAREFAAI